MNKNDFKVLRWKNFHKENEFILKKINQHVSKNSGWKQTKKCSICFSTNQKFYLKNLMLKF